MQALSSRRGFLLLAGLCVWISACVGMAPAGVVALDVSLPEVLANMRSALGWQALAARSGGWQTSGTCLAQGVPGTFQGQFTPGGRFAHHTHSELGGSEGYDGRTTWLRDSTGMPRVLSLSSRDDLLAGSWVSHGLWLAPDTERLEVTLVPNQSSASELALMLGMPGRPWRAMLVVDRDTWLPKSFLQERPGGTARVEFSDWRAPQGFQVAHRTVATGVSGSVSTYTVEAVEPLPTFVRDPFAVGQGRPADTTWDVAQPAEIEVRRTQSGHVLVHPLLDGQDVGWFLLDSGAGMNCIDPGAADRLGWEAFGEVAVLGAAGAGGGRYRRGGRLELGPLRVQETPFLELDLSALEPVFGVPVGGVMGYDLFARAVVVVDLQASRVWLHDPELWEPPAQVEQLVLDSAVPCVRCRFAGFEGWFRLDTGSDDTVTFHAPAVRSLGLTEGRSDLSRVTLQGVSGVAQADRGRITWFELGGRRFERLPVTYMRPSQGALDAVYTVGNIGGGLLAEFRVAFDLGRRQVAFQ